MNVMTRLPKKYITLFAIGGIVLIWMIFFHQFLFSGEIVNATDVLTQRYFWYTFIKENLSIDPCFKTWLPYINSGTPFEGGLGKIFKPVTLVTLLALPPDLAVTYELVLYLLVLGVGMYVYMRSLSVTPRSAFLASLFLMLNGELVTLLNAGHVAKLGAICVTPFVFYGLERALQRKTLTAFMLAGALLGIQFWQGHIQICFYTNIAVGIYYLIRVGLMYRQSQNLRQISRLTGFAILMVIIYLLLSAVNFLPLLSFAEVSDRAEGVSYEFATSWSMPPEELITYVIPQFFGFRRLNHFEDEDIIPYWGRMPFTQTGRYFGLLPLLFLLLAVGFVRNKHVLTLSVIAVATLLLGMGRYIPTYRFLYEHVPGFNMFRVPQMILFLFAFAASALAGFGVEWFFRDFSERQERRFRVFLLGGMMIFLLSWLLTMLLPQSQEAVFAMFEQAFMRKGATPEVASARFMNIFNGILRFNVFLGLSVFALGLRLVKSVSRWKLLLAILVVFLADIWLFNEKYLDTIRLDGTRYINENDTIRYCKANPGLYRIMPLTNKPSTYGVPNKVVYHKLYSVSGYEAVGVQYYDDYVKRMTLGSPLVDLLNIKYLIFPTDTQFGEQPAKVGDRFGPYKVVMKGDALLLENLRVLPRAFAVHQASVLTARDDILAVLQNPTFNPRETVVLEETPPVAPPAQPAPAAQSNVRIIDYANRRIQLEAAMASDGFVVLSEKYYPGWRVRVDGQPAHLYKANYTLQAVAVPQGAHTLTFAYHPTDFWWGLAITLITGLSVAGALVFGKKAER
jgi:hypothetical protein